MLQTLSLLLAMFTMVDEINHRKWRREKDDPQFNPQTGEIYMLNFLIGVVVGVIFNDQIEQVLPIGDKNE